MQEIRARVFRNFKIQKEIAKQGTNFGALEFSEKNVSKRKNVSLFFVQEAQKSFLGE